MDNNADHREEDEAPAGDDEDTGAPVAPIVRLEEVAVSTGEEDEEALLDLKSKLYRFDKDGNQWKERGAGTVKFLKHKVTGKVRLLVRQSKTLKICANHLIGSGMSVQEHAGNEKSCVWHARDFADGEELKDELFCIRFASIENCRLFMEKFQEIAESKNHEDNGDNQNSGKNQNNEEKQDACTAAGLLENLSVKEKENQNNGENQNSEEKQNNGGNQDALAAAGLLENLSVKEKEDAEKDKEHSTST